MFNLSPNRQHSTSYNDSLQLINTINELTIQVKQQCNQSDYKEFIELQINNQQLINENQIIKYLFHKLTSLIALNYKPFIIEIESIDLKIVGFTALISTDKLNPKPLETINQLNEFLELDFNILKGSHLNLIKSIKTILKTNSNLTQQFQTNSTEYLLKVFTTEFIATSFNYKQLYLGNKLIKCILLYLKSFENIHFTSQVLKICAESNVLNSIANNEYLHAKMITFIIELSFKSDQNIELNEVCSKLDLIFTSLDDDLLIDFNLICLQQQQLKTKSQLFEFDLNSHVLFVKLMASVTFDYEVLINWLCDNETNFLIYFVKYLKYLINELNINRLDNINRLFSNDKQFEIFHSVLGDEIEPKKKPFIGKYYLNRTLTLLIELKDKIKRLNNHFGYNINPLIKLLEQISLFKF